MLKIKKNIPLIDQHDRSGFWGGKFGGNFIPETLKSLYQIQKIYFQNSEKIKISLKKEINILKIGLVHLQDL